MASSASATSAVYIRTPLWLWPNVLSLDAPLIALLWQNSLARDAEAQLSIWSRAALGLAVWLVYLIDRLLDTRYGMPASVSARHKFCSRHRAVCRLLAAAVSVCLCVSVWMLPLPLVRNGLIVAAFVGLYLFAVHAMGILLPKEAAVAIMFAIGSGLAPFTLASDQRLVLLPALLFGVLCWANTSGIELCEGGSMDRASNWIATHMKTVAGAVCALSLLLEILRPWDCSASALLLTGIGLMAVTTIYSELAPDALRVALDVPLLAPLLVIGLR